MLFESWILFGLYFATFFIKYSSNFFTIETADNICPSYSIFYFLDQKDILKTIWRITLWKNIFVFWYSNMTTQVCYCGDTLDTIVTLSRKNLPILKEYENKVICFCFASFSAKYFIYGQMEHQFCIYCSKSYCKLSFGGISPPAVPFWSQCKLLMCYYNQWNHCTTKNC